MKERIIFLLFIILPNVSYSLENPLLNHFISSPFTENILVMNKKVESFDLFFVLYGETLDYIEEEGVVLIPDSSTKYFKRHYFFEELEIIVYSYPEFDSNFYIREVRINNSSVRLNLGITFNSTSQDIYDLFGYPQDIIDLKYLELLNCNEMRYIVEEKKMSISFQFEYDVLNEVIIRYF